LLSLPDYQVVLWGKAHSREALVTDFAAMAGLLELREKDAEDQSVVAGAVKRWIESNDGWLLILDNADELAMAREFIPSSESGHVLLIQESGRSQPGSSRPFAPLRFPRSRRDSGGDIS
jgi:hypothetical protein